MSASDLRPLFRLVAFDDPISAFLLRLIVVPTVGWPSQTEESRRYPTSRADAVVAQTASTRPRPVVVGGNRGLRSCRARDLRAFTW